jgi:hypothetical protein
MTTSRRLGLLCALVMGLAACGGGGNMHVEWDIVAPEDCEPGDYVLIEVAGFAGEEYNCTAYEAFTASYPAGTYSVRITLYDEFDVSLDTLTQTVTILDGLTVSTGLALFDI